MNGISVKKSNRDQTRENYESGVMPDIDYFYKLEMKIKKTNRKYLSNCHLNESVLKKAVEQAEITYVYKEGEYLNFWRKRKRFRRLYYFIADPRHYKVQNYHETCVCDAVCRGKDASGICGLLSDAGMRQYKVYREWICSSPILQDIHNCCGLEVVDDDDGELFIEGLKCYFDELSDMLPDNDEWGEFIRNRKFIGVHDAQSKALTGGMVYTKRGCVITEEFVFVHLDYRGQGISKCLHNALYQKYAAEKIKYTAWIRSDNLESRNLHRDYNYQKQDLFKFTFLQNYFMNEKENINGGKSIEIIGRHK